MGSNMFGDAVRSYREAIGWSQKDLADELGVNRQTVGRWECGIVPRHKHIEAIAKVFGITTSDLLKGTPCEWVEDVLSRLRYELSIVDANLEEGLPDSLKAYALGKREALTMAIEMIKKERKAKA